MKKKILKAMVLLTALCVVGCGKGDAGKENSQETDISKENGSVNETKGEEKENDDGKTDKVIKLSDGTELDGNYVDRNVGYTMKSIATMRSLADGVDCYYERLAGGETRYIQTSEDILDNMLYKIVDCYNPRRDIEECTKDSMERLTINGLDATKWSGVLTLGFDATGGTERLTNVLPYVAYGILGSDGRPYLFAAYNAQKDKYPEDTAYMEELLDAMVSTFKENPLPSEYKVTDDVAYMGDGKWMLYLKRED